jgi:hypothetical protein
MKTIFTKFILFFALFVSYLLSAQTYNYTWMKGTPSTSLAVYGTLGVANASNNPGSQNEGITWTDQSGNLWLFGGNGYNNSNSGGLNDLWKYSPLTNNWTWVNGSGLVGQTPVYGTLGVSSASNNPGGRVSSATWADASGNLWLFGGSTAVGVCNDLWRYNITANQWTWMGGSNTPSQTAVFGSIGVLSTTNIPGASYNFASWKDTSGNFWLYDGVRGTEVWKYNPSAAQWALMSASSTNTAFAVFGTKGVPSSSVNPGARQYSRGVADASGNLYVFGGKIYTATGFGRSNDLWKYDISINQWTWVSGTGALGANDFGVYGTQGVFSSTTVPGSRFGHVLWIDGTNKLWLFGGEYLNLVGLYGLNDTWCFDITTGQWAWMKGSSTAFLIQLPSYTGAVYGTQTVPAVSNTPGWHSYASYWPYDPAALWMFSGNDFYPNTELWRLNSCTPSSPVSISSSQATLCTGATAILTASGASGTYSWNTGTQTSTISVSPSITTVYQAVSNGTCYSAANFTLPVQSQAISIFSATNTLCSGQSTSLTASGASTFTWNSGQTGSVVVISPLTTTIYSVSGANSCTPSASYTQVVNPSPMLNISSSPSVSCSGNPVFISVSGAVSYNWNNGQTTSSFSNSPLSTTVYSLTGTTNGCTSSATYTQVVNSNPVLNVSSSPSVSCGGNPVFISVSGAVSYNWNNGQTASSFSNSPLSTTVYSLTGTTNGCTSSASYTQIVNPSPVLNVSSSPSVSCSGNLVFLSVSGAVSYSWNNGLTTPSFSASPFSTTVYTVTGTTGSCSTIRSFTQQVLPLPNIHVSGSTNARCMGEALLLIASGANTYTWSLQGLTTPVIQVSPALTTTYTVTGANNSGCKALAAVTVTVLNCTDFREYAGEENYFSVYPNPASTPFTIRTAGVGILKVINSLGQLVLEQKLESETIVIHDRLLPGIYYCTINGIGKTLKLLIQN